MLLRELHKGKRFRFTQESVDRLHAHDTSEYGWITTESNLVFGGFDLHYQFKTLDEVKAGGTHFGDLSVRVW